MSQRNFAKKENEAKGSMRRLLFVLPKMEDKQQQARRKQPPETSSTSGRLFLDENLRLDNEAFPSTSHV